MKTREEIEHQIKALENDLKVSKTEPDQRYRAYSLELQIDVLKWVLAE